MSRVPSHASRAGVHDMTRSSRRGTGGPTGPGQHSSRTNDSDESSESTNARSLDRRSHGNGRPGKDRSGRERRPPPEMEERGLA